MSNYSVSAIDLNMTFGRRLIFSKINFSFEQNGIYGISGPKGKIVHKNSDKEIIPEKLHNYIGFVSPYLVLYEEFSAWENLIYYAKIRGILLDRDLVKDLLERFLLYNRRDDLIKTYSSGMKQRMKFVFALIHKPQLLILDEPTSNLDEEGKTSAYDLIKAKAEESIVVIASNEQTDLNLCGEILDLNNYKAV
jgi:heme exporter protein A